MNPVILAPQEDMMERIYPELYREGVDYSENLVVFPGKRPAHYLRKAIAQKEKRSFLPPVIYSIEELINLIFDRLYNWKEIQRIDAIAILYKLCKRLPGLREEFKNLDNFYAFGNTLFKALEELYIENIPVEKLRGLDTLIDIPQKSKYHITFLSYIYRKFYNTLTERELSTRSLRYRKVAEAQESYSIIEPFKRIIFAGFFAFTESEKLFLKKLIKKEEGSERLSFFFHDGDGVEQTISSLGLSRDVSPSRDFPLKVPDLYAAPDLHGEIKIAGELIREIKVLDERTVIVLPQSEPLFSLLRQGIAFLDEAQYNISMGYPLIRTPIYGFFLNLFEIYLSINGESLYVPDYLKFMLHPYTKNIRFKREDEQEGEDERKGKVELNRIILHELENLFKKDRLSPFTRLEDIEADVAGRIYQGIKDMVLPEGLRPEDIRHQLRFIHDNTIRQFISFENIEEFLRKCRKLLLFIYENSTARLHPLFYPYMETFVKELEKACQSELRSYSFEKKESYFNFFKKLLSYCNVPFEGTPLRGLQILGFLETRNIKFKKVIFLDLNEGVFPDLSEDYLLPYSVRKSLGLPTYQDRERLLYYYFKNLLCQAEEVHLFYIKNDRIERSRFLEKLLWDIEKEGKKPKEYIINYKIDLSTKRPSEIKKTDEVIELLKSLPLSASLLDEYLKCGLRFYYSAVLGLKKEKELLMEPDRADIGSLVHEALKIFFKKRLSSGITSIGGEVTSSDSSRELERIIYNLFYERYGVVAGRLYLLRYQIIRKLKELLSWVGEVFKENVILSVEEDITEEINNTSLKSRLDLILRDKGQYIIIDYKTSSKPDRVKIDFKKLSHEERTTWNEAIKSLQIPLYMMLYKERYNTGIENIDGYYLLLGKKKLNKDAIYSPFNSEKTTKFEIISKVLKDLIDEIKNPDIPFMPPVELKEECPSCNYKPICGTEWVKGYEF